MKIYKILNFHSCAYSSVKQSKYELLKLANNMNFYPTFVHFDRLYKSILQQQEKLKCDLHISSYEEIPYDTFKNPRKWELTEYGNQFSHIKPFMSNCMEISVASYNVLAQFLIKSNMYLYSKCDENHLAWEYRQKNLLAEIKHLDCDIFCFQEIQADHYINFYYPELTKLGYDGVFKKRTRDKVDGCATFFKAHKFNLETAKGLEYYRPGTCHLLDRDNVALLTVLVVKGLTSTSCPANAPTTAKGDTGKPAKYVKLQGKQGAPLRLCVANTHLLFNPKRDDVKLSQLHLLLAEVDKLSRSYPPALDGLACKQRVAMPVILCGDFNLTPTNDIYQRFLTPRSRFGPKISAKTLPTSANILAPADLRLLLTCLRTDQWSRYLDDQTNSCGGGGGKIDLTLRHNFDLHSVYDHYKNPPVDGNHDILTPEITTKNAMASVTVDYLLYTSPPGTNRTSHTSIEGEESNGEASDLPPYYSAFMSSPALHRDTTGDQMELVGGSSERKRKPTTQLEGGTAGRDDASTDVACGSLRLLARYMLLSEMEVAEAFERGDLPNAYLSSDHFSLAAKFLLCA